MRVIISLAVISSRVDTLHITLGSLLAQDHDNFEVRVHISPEPYLLDGGITELPAASRKLVSEDARLSVRSVRNIGPYRKLLPILTDLIDADVLIATADDDTVYPVDWLSTMVSHHRRFGGIICNRGHRIQVKDGAFAPYRGWMTADSSERSSVMILPTGKDGVLYHSSFFHPFVIDHARAMLLAPTADDLWFKWHTAVYGVPVYRIHTSYAGGSLPEVSSGPSLYQNFNRAGGNDAAIAALHSYSIECLGFDLAREPFQSNLESPLRMTS
jgi:hypothetical protein